MYTLTCQNTEWNSLGAKNSESSNMGFLAQHFLVFKRKRLGQDS